jgi:hypothetical protein
MVSLCLTENTIYHIHMYMYNMYDNICGWMAAKKDSLVRMGIRRPKISDVSHVKL